MKMTFVMIVAASAVLVSGCVMRAQPQGGAYSHPGPYGYGNYPPPYPNYPPPHARGGYEDRGGGGYRESGGSQTSMRESGGGRANCKGDLSVSVSDAKTTQQEVRQVMDYVTALLCDNPPEMTPAKPSIIDWKADWKPESSGSLKTKSGTTISWREK